MKDLRVILAGLGGVDNIRELEPCVTRLRVVVEDPALVDAPAVRRAGAHGLLVRGDVVQVVIGPELDVMISALTEQGGWHQASDE